jgi:hypothetical protein
VFERGVETRGVPGREQLLGVGGAAFPTQTFGHPQLNIQETVIGAGVAVSAISGRSCVCRVQRLHAFYLTRK